MINHLSFIGDDNSWSPSRGGDYAENCARGRAAAIELHQFVYDNNAPHVVPHVFQSMVVAGRHEGFEIGFATGLGAMMLGGRR